MLKSHRNLFARLLDVGTVRLINIDEMLTYSLSPLPQSFANFDGSDQQSKADAHARGGHQPNTNSEGHSTRLRLDMGCYGSSAAAEATVNIWTLH